MNISYSHSFPSFDDQVIEAAYKSLQNGDFSARNVTKIAEYKLADFTGVSFCKLTSSGYSALEAALIGVGICKGDCVIIPTVTCPSVYHSIISVGCKPVVLDVDLEQPILSIDAIRKWRAENHSRAIVIVPQMFGLVSNLKEYLSETDVVIEDAAQAFRPNIDLSADVTVFSFSPTKLQTIGYAGSVLTNNEKYFNRIQQFLDPDHNIFISNDISIPYRMHSQVTDFQSAMLISQIDRYAAVINYRRELFNEYDKHLNNPIRLHPIVPFRYQLLLEKGNAAEVAQSLQQVSIMAFPLASHLLHNVFNIVGDFKNAEYWYQRTLSLPLHENLNSDDIAYISNKVRCYL